ncbi:hypothetical protein CLAFUW4_08780 [Fulvia fulva]|uniref:Uncharacterized protein n=1 Tax=Passalora fulva TaxID=5499 RepID=A0A9Q8PHA3_PASFU|nr:uncharacterized protein CLAFUR5_08895 [Fulvia fulva]KAK4614064.1 hypothetical protein CLAFUR4_08786 [Fulvia fulva]KAK4615212.1 hypothetical protein CLAFUR0_08778 [Fulvia fulva]UJO22414.1 hypothetical protein CLAFUR5_08895 [Fulvia fulva]WPV19954.1 hypothetical protein CLAFUW4_08780 [Fulvia fulva]WPV34785.1 hypothetical protein CLAFUW7_08781 [Fulvia fulva]
MAPTKQPTPKPFHFFSLPGELRNEIYDNLSTGPLPVPNRRFNRKDLHATIKDGLCPNFQLVNRQFRSEYEQRHANRSILIVDVLVPDLNPGFFIQPRQMRRCVGLEVVLRCRGGSIIGHNMEFQSEAVPNIVECLPNIKKAEVKVLITRCQDPAAPKSTQEILQRTHHALIDKFLETEEMVALRVLLADDLKDGVYVKEKDHGVLRTLGEWKRGDGWKYAE